MADDPKTGLPPGVTPGPWRKNGPAILAKGETDTYSGVVWGRIATAEDLEDFDREGRRWWTSGDAEANARLIAAAPDLYRALAEFVWRMETDDLNAVSFEHIYNKARAALAAARKEGER